MNDHGYPQSQDEVDEAFAVVKAHIEASASERDPDLDTHFDCAIVTPVGWEHEDLTAEDAAATVVNALRYDLDEILKAGLQLEIHEAGEFKTVYVTVRLVNGELVVSAD